MSAGDWARVEELFHRARELDGAERAALLAVQPDEIRRRVESLLRHAGESDRIARAVSGAAALAGHPPGTVGAYRLVREIGHGGMGAVYLAERADQVFDKQVAIKFVRGAVDSPELRHRFEEERRILARLEHPGIARLIDGGATPEGLPYLVMEYVEGETITRYALDHGLSVRDRIVLFRMVCGAVQYAHQNLVVHRDLKPGNVMIDREGHPKLLDFGIAKLASPSEAPASQTVVRVLTPDYASPEQMRGDAVTTATDIYSLGAVLFELLVGKPPFHDERGTPAPIEHAIEHGNVKRPSECHPAMARALRGDLDSIVLKAMRRLPEERYTSAAELSSDLERFLHGWPVAASDYTIWQRGGKFVARHRVSVLAADAVMASLLVGGVLVTRSAVRADEARRQAVVERQKAEQQRQEAVRQAGLALDRQADALTQRAIADRRLLEQEQALSSFLERFYRDIRNLTGATDVRKRMLDSGIRQLENLRQERPEDRAVLGTLALGYQEMGRLLGDPVAPSLGDATGGQRMLRRAAGMFEELHRAEPAQLSYLLELSTVYRHLAEIESDRSIDPGSGFEAAGLAVAKGRAAVALAPSRFEAQDVLCHALLTRFLLGVGRDISRMHLEDVREARRIVEPLVAEQPEKPEYLMLLADTYAAESNYGRMRLEYAAALPLAERALELREKSSALLRNDTNVLRSLMSSYNAVADLYRPVPGSAVLPERAVECYEHAAAISERLAQGDPADRTAQYHLALSFIRLAGLNDARGDDATGLRNADHAIRIFRGIRREVEQNLVWRLAFTGALLVYEGICREAGRPEAVEPALREALEEALAIARNDQRPESSLRTASIAAERLAGWTTARDPDRAIEFAEQSVQFAEQSRKVPGAGPFTVLRLAQARGEAALLYARVAGQRRDEALRSRARALAEQSIAVMTELNEPQMANWPRATRDRVKELAGH